MNSTNDVREDSGLDPITNDTKPVTLQVQSTPKLTLRSFAWALLGRLALLIAAAVVFGYLTFVCWNTLTDITTLPDITFQQAVCGWVLLYAAARAVKV